MPQKAPTSLYKFLLVWLGLGVQSFGGGAATLALIRTAAVDRYAWLTADEFTRDWALCQVAPGINLLGLTILIGRRAAGAAGVALALTGLLLPSGVITVAITATYSHYKHMAVVQSALRGIIPATVGIGFVTACQIAGPILDMARRQSRTTLIFIVVLMVICAAAVALLHPSVVTVLCVAGASGAVFQWLRERKPSSAGGGPAA